MNLWQLRFFSRCDFPVLSPGHSPHVTYSFPLYLLITLSDVHANYEFDEGGGPCWRCRSLDVGVKLRALSVSMHSPLRLAFGLPRVKCFGWGFIGFQLLTASSVVMSVISFL